MSDLSTLQQKKAELEHERDSIVEKIHELRARARQKSLEASSTRQPLPESEIQYWKDGIKEHQDKLMAVQAKLGAANKELRKFGPVRQLRALGQLPVPPKTDKRNEATPSNSENSDLFLSCFHQIAKDSLDPRQFEALVPWRVITGECINTNNKPLLFLMIDLAEQQPSQEPEKSSRFPSDLDDPYSLWADLPPGALLPYSQVLLGFTSWLRGHYRPMWIEQSPHPTPWHLDRWSGLHGWCQAEAEGRLSERYQEMYSDADFMVLHLGEAIMSGKPDVLKSPFWTPLFVMRQLTWDPAFFEYVARALQRKGDPAHGQRRLLAILYDRAFVPLEFWTSTSISEFWRHCVDANAPSPGLIRRWLGLMKLELAYPSIVTGFGRNGIARFNKEAAELHGLPKS